MASTVIQPKKRGIDPDRLSDQQLVFVNELAADGNFNATEAARKAGYKRPATHAGKLLKQPKVAAALGKVLYDRLERCRLTQDDVLNYLQAALFFNPLHYFQPTEDGQWLIADPAVLPEEVGMLIDSLEVHRQYDRDGNPTEDVFKVKLVSKATALGLAMRHVGVEKHEVKHTLDWDSLVAHGNGQAVDVIETHIAQETTGN